MTKHSPPTNDAAAQQRAYAKVVAVCARMRGVTQEQKKGFGSGALKVNGRIFAMLASNGDFVVKLPKARVDELVAAGDGERFEPGPGRVMKEWLAFAGPPTRWRDLAREGYDFVKRAPARRR